MKKITSYFCLLFLIFSSACSSDDSSKNAYPKISDQEKALLLGKWQLLNYSCSNGEVVDFKQEGILIYYHFGSGDVLEIQNLSPHNVGITDFSFRQLTESKKMTYMFGYMESKYEKEINGEKLYFVPYYFAFDMEISQDHLIIKGVRGATLTFKRSTTQNEVEYPGVSLNDKVSFYGRRWKLNAIYAFNREERIFKEEEEVIYHFAFGDYLVVESNVVLENEVFEHIIKPRKAQFSYRYDFEWQKRELLYMTDLGGFSVHLEGDNLTLAQYDGYILQFHKQ